MDPGLQREQRRHRGARRPGLLALHRPVVEPSTLPPSSWRRPPCHPPVVEASTPRSLATFPALLTPVPALLTALLASLTRFPASRPSLPHAAFRNHPPPPAQIAVGQLLALGAFPAHIKPFIFAWPNGKELTYPLAETLAGSDVMRKDLKEFFRSLLDDTGVDQIHVLVHSMGSKVFFNALPDIAELFASRGATLATCILLNADSPLDEFVNTGYPVLRRCCHHITVYSDVNDMGSAARLEGAPAHALNPRSLPIPARAAKSATATTCVMRAAWWRA